MFICTNMYTHIHHTNKNKNRKGKEKEKKACLGQKQNQQVK